MPKPSIGAPAWSISRELILVESAAGEDAHLAQPAFIEDAADTLGQRDEIAAVQAHAADRDPARLEPRRKRNDLPRGRLGIVGIDQKRQVLGPRLREVLERGAFRRRRLG